MDQSWGLRAAHTAGLAGIRDQQHAFSGRFRVVCRGARVGGAERPEAGQSLWVSGDFFRLLGGATFARPALPSRRTSACLLRLTRAVVSYPYGMPLGGRDLAADKQALVTASCTR